MVEVYAGRGRFTKSVTSERNLSAMNRFLKIAVAVSLGWNVLLVIGVIANQGFASTRAAGGQFDSFPTGIRIAYLLNLAIVIYQALVIFKRVKSSRMFVKSLFILSTISVLVNAFSKSAAERWNAIPAAIIAYAFYREVTSNKG
jgi:hypothetical protein